MPESVIATSVLLPELQTALTATAYEAVGGGNDRKRLLQGELGGRDISLLERPFDQDYIDAWIAFREAGMPVVPTLRTRADESLLVTDAKAGGSEVYGVGLYRIVARQIDEQRTRVRPDIDKLFLNVARPDNFPAIRDEARRLVQKANDNNLRLPYDDPFELLVHPNGTWELITLDLHFAKAFDPRRDSSNKIEDSRKRNYADTDTLLDTLVALHEQLSEPAPIQRKRPLGRLLGWTLG